jgi:hypothetical protein
MAPELLPTLAVALAPRAPSVVVLNSKVEPWLSQTLMRINKSKGSRHFDTVSKRERHLADTLSSTNAIWTLASLLLPKAPKPELTKDASPLIDSLVNSSVSAVVSHKPLSCPFPQNFPIPLASCLDC